MSKPMIQVDSEVREMTDAEYAQWQIDEKSRADHAAAVTAKEKARASAHAKLADLGLTENEIEALVG